MDTAVCEISRGFMKHYTLAELATKTSSQLVGDPNHKITDVADLQTAENHDASFLANPRYEQAMKKSLAGVIFVDASVQLIPGRNFLISNNPSKAFQLLVDSIHEETRGSSAYTGIHHTAIIHHSCTIGQNVTIGPYAVIDKDAIIGDRSIISAHCTIGPSTTIGSDCLIHPSVIIRERCCIGNRVILQPGVVIGSCGFGYITDAQGKHSKLNQVGTVTIEDDVEIGANTTIDRARFKTTLIRKGTKIDNLVQIGHGVIIGENNIIVAQTGIAGSSKTGRNVVLGGQVAVNGHIELADGVMVAGCSGVSKTLSKAGKYNGIPAVPLKEYNRNSVYLRNIESYVKRLEALEKKMNDE